MSSDPLFEFSFDASFFASSELCFFGSNDGAGFGFSARGNKRDLKPNNKTEEILDQITKKYIILHFLVLIKDFISSYQSQD